MAFRNLLNRDLAKALTREIREPAGAALREVVDDGVRVFERCNATVQGQDENLGVPFSFDHLIEMLGATRRCSTNHV